MRILLDARFMDSTWAAPSAYARQLIQHLSLVDDKNEYLIVVRPGLKDRLSLGSNFELVSYRPHPLSLRSMLGFHRMLEEIRPDLVHFLSPVVPLLYRGPTLISVHDLRALSDADEASRRSPLVRISRSLMGRLVYPRTFRRALWILCSSYTVRQELLRFFPHLTPKMIVVLPGLPAEAHERVPPAQIEAIRAKCEITTQYLFSSVPGHASRTLVPLVRAFAVLLADGGDSAQGLQLVMSVRRDGTLRDVRRAISQSRIGDRVLLLEGLEREEERALMAGAKAFVFPACKEGSGMTLLEAMALGIPIVAARDGALPEVCGDSSLYADPDDTGEFAAALAKVVSDEALQERLSQCGKDMASRREWKDSARLVREIYQDLF